MAEDVVKAPAAGRGPLLAALLLLNLLVLPLALAGLHTGGSDTFYHLAGGRWMAEHGRVLDRETFSFTIPGAPWTNYYWLFEVVLFAAFRAGGWGGVIALRAVLAVATANVLFATMRRRARGGALEALAFTLAAFVVYIGRALAIRPHLASYLFLALLVPALERFRESGRRFDLRIPLLCALWASLHGVELPVPLALVAVEGAADAWARAREGGLRALARIEALRWPLLLAACAAAACANPFGPAVLLTPRIGTDAAVMARIREMAPFDWRTALDVAPDLARPSAPILRWMLLAGLALVPGWLRERRLAALGAFGLVAALALSKTRFEAEFALVAIPLVAAGAARAREAATGLRPLLLRGAVAGLALFCAATCVVASVDGARHGLFEPVDRAQYPVDAARFLAEAGLGAGDVACDPRFAGYVEWALPEARVAADMRAPEPFDAAHLALAEALASGGVSLDTARRTWPVVLAIAERGSPLAARLASGAEPDFVIVYADDGWVAAAHASLLRGERPRGRR